MSKHNTRRKSAQRSDNNVKREFINHNLNYSNFAIQGSFKRIKHTLRGGKIGFRVIKSNGTEHILTRSMNRRTHAILQSRGPLDTVMALMAGIEAINPRTKYRVSLMDYPKVGVDPHSKRSHKYQIMVVAV